jgi:opacity protein-like surface antigen
VKGRWLVAALVACQLLVPAVLWAQNLSPRVEVGVGGRWFGRASLGQADANATTADGGTFRLFSTESELAPAFALEGRLGVRLSRALQLEGSVSYGTPEFRTDVTLDVEGAADETVSESVRQIALEGSIVAELSGWRIGERTTPFVSGGAGYLRQLHERGTLAETGVIYHGGGGLNILLRRPRPPAPGTRAPLAKSIGIRADVRAVVRTGGVTLNDGAHVSPAAGSSLFFRF